MEGGHIAHPAVDKFGKLVVNQLRDLAIDFFDRAAKGQWKGMQRLQHQLAKFTPDQIDLVRRCVIHAVDHGMHAFLFALVEGHDFENGINVIVDGENVVELSDGLHGEQFTNNGWIAKFGKHPELTEE